MAVHGRRRIGLHEGQLGTHENRGQHVVEVMRHAAGQPGRPSPSLGLDDLRLQANLLSFGMLAVGDVGEKLTNCPGTGRNADTS